MYEGCSYPKHNQSKSYPLPAQHYQAYSLPLPYTYTSFHLIFNQAMEDSNTTLALPSSSSSSSSLSSSSPSSSSPPPNFLYFAHQKQDKDAQVQLAWIALSQRNDRQQHWLAERRKEQRDAARKTVVQQRLKFRTEQLAARWSSDPSLATGRRLAARAHAEARKIVPRRKLLPTADDADKTQLGAVLALPPVHRGSMQPLRRVNAGSISSIPELAIHRAAHPDSTFLNWDEMDVPHSGKWQFAGKEYSTDEIFRVVADKIAIVEAYQIRMNQRKVFHRSFELAMEILRDAMHLTWRGAWVYTPFNILPPLPKSRPTAVKRLPPYAKRWDRRSIADIAWSHHLRDQQRAAVLNPPARHPASMDIDANDGWTLGGATNMGGPPSQYSVPCDGSWVDLRTIDIPTFNTKPIQWCAELFGAMTLDQMRMLRSKLSALRQQGQGNVHQGRFNQLSKNIAEREKRSDGGKGRQGQDDPRANLRTLLPQLGGGDAGAGPFGGPGVGFGGGKANRKDGRGRNGANGNFALAHAKQKNQNQPGPAVERRGFDYGPPVANNRGNHGGPQQQKPHGNHHGNQRGNPRGNQHGAGPQFNRGGLNGGNGGSNRQNQNNHNPNNQPGGGRGGGRGRGPQGGGGRGHGGGRGRGRGM